MKTANYRFLIALLVSLCAPQAYAAEQNRYETALTPLIETTLSSRVAGYIKAINVTEGAAFKKGEVLVKIDCDLHISDLRYTEAELRGAREVYAARQKLDGLKSISKLDVTLSAVEVEKLEADRNRKQKTVENCEIKAPFSGVVTEIHAKSFQNVGEGEPLLKIIDTTTVQLEFFVPSSDVARFTPGLALDFYINETGKNYKAELVALIPRIDPVSQTFKAIARIDNPDKMMLPGMSGYITLPGDPAAAKPAVEVPPASVPSTILAPAVE